MHRGSPVWLFLLAALVSTPACGAASTVDAPARALDLVVSSPSALTEIDVREADDVLRVGDVFTDTAVFESLDLMTIRKGPREKQLVIQTRERVSYRVEIVRAADGTARRARATFTEDRKTFTIEGDTKEKETSIRLGVAYLVDLSREPVEVTVDSGRPVSATERDDVVKKIHLARWTRPATKADGSDTGSHAPPVHRVRVGEAAPWLVSRLERDLSIASSGRARTAHVPLARVTAIREVEGKPYAVVEIRLQVTSAGEDEDRADMDLTGEVLVKAEDGSMPVTVLKGIVRAHGRKEEPDGDVYLFDSDAKLRAQVTETTSRGPAPD